MMSVENNVDSLNFMWDLVYMLCCAEE